MTVSGRANAIVVENISKSYGAVKALSNVAFTVAGGSIHAILGENGAGKSTLMKIIGGETPPDAGDIIVHGKRMERFTPQSAHANGIQIVHQELAVFENLTVAENIFPWHAGGKMPLVDWRGLSRRAAAILEMFSRTTISPSQKMATVPLAGQHIIEILRCIAAEPKIIILDEPTSGLNDDEANRLMDILRGLRDRGYTILYISHRLKEILAISDFVTVLRDGKYVTTVANDAELTEETLIRLMVGRDLSGSLYSRKRYSCMQGMETLAEFRNFASAGFLCACDFDVHKGEMHGVFGLEGSGAGSLSKMIYGLEAADSGEVVFKGRKLGRPNPTEMVANGIMYLNDNRKHGGLFLDMPARDSVAAPILNKVSRAGFLNFGKLSEVVKKYIAAFSIAIPGVLAKPRTLYGGNQQKGMIAACLAAEPELLVVNEPTRGSTWAQKPRSIVFWAIYPRAASA